MSEFPAGRAPEHLGDPAQDPPMVCRVQPSGDPHSPDARRVIRTDAVGAPWFAVTGQGRGRWLTDRDVATWPVQHPIVYGTTFRHAAAADARGSSSQVLDGGDAEGDRPFRAGSS